jgi:hypothetical protein
MGRAYNWPHRAGGGLCRWPDEPLRRLTTPQGTQSGKAKISEAVRKDSGVKMRGITDSINFDRQGEVEEISEPSARRR